MPPRPSRHNAVHARVRHAERASDRALAFASGDAGADLANLLGAQWASAVWLILAALAASVLLRGQRVADAPSMAQPVSDAISRDAKDGCPLRQREPTTFVLEHDRRVSVQDVLASARPAHVARLVVSVAIGEPVDLSARERRRPHVGDEVFNRQPPIADADSSASVAVVALRSGIGAALHHRSPHAVGRVPGQPVASVARSDATRSGASARDRGVALGSQRCGADSLVGAAVAPAPPERSALLDAAEPRDDQLAKPLAAQIVESWAGRYRLEVAHGEGPLVVGKWVAGVAAPVACASYGTWLPRGSA